ncbi:MAG: chemotaxis protein CheD [Pirellulaceae bacterium]|nr:chemotaxis protein CheD [Pirellulaceae bacterium]
MVFSTTNTDNKVDNKITVGIGQVFGARAPATFHSVLGSCIGVVLYSRQHKTGAMAHVVLPAQVAGSADTPGKYADTAIKHMLKLLAREGVMLEHLTAKITGGAAMFNTSGPLQIGEKNIDAVKAELTNANIRLGGDDTGGTKGRRVTFDLETGMFTVETVGQEPTVF